MHAFTFSCPAKTSAGIHALEHLPFELRAMGASKPMVIPDAAAAKKTKQLTRAFAASDISLGLSSPVPGGPDTEETALFVRSLFDHFREKGFDAIIAMGGEDAANAAKALNIAVSSGPDALKKGEVTQALSPLVYLPTGTGAMAGTAASARFNTRTFDAPALCPDLVLIDPSLMLPEERSRIIDNALSCLAVGCEAFALSPAPPARAYAATIVSLARTVLDDLLASGLKGPDHLKAGEKEVARAQKRLVQAAVMAGHLISSPEPLFSHLLGQIIGAKGRTSPGHIALVVLPTVLESKAGPKLGQLFRHLSDDSTFSAVPGPQQSLAALQKIRELTHRLFSLSHGLLPRTLAEAGWSPESLANLSEEIATGHHLAGEQRSQLNHILACAWDGRPMGA